MPLMLKPFGTLRCYPSLTMQTPGPIAIRSATYLGGGTWTNELFGKAELEFGMGSYLSSPDSGNALITIRAAMRCEDGSRFFIEYQSRGHMPSHASGQSAVMMSGAIETDPKNPKYAFLNGTFVLGRGMLTYGELENGLPIQTYEMSLLSEDNA